MYMLRTLLATVSSATVNMGTLLSVHFPAFNSLGYMPKSQTAGSQGNSIFNFGWGTEWVIFITRRCSSTTHFRRAYQQWHKLPVPL